MWGCLVCGTELHSVTLNLEAGWFNWRLITFLLELQYLTAIIDPGQGFRANAFSDVEIYSGMFLQLHCSWRLCRLCEVFFTCSSCSRALDAWLMSLPLKIQELISASTRISTGAEMTHDGVFSPALSVTTMFPNIKILHVKYSIHTSTTGSWFKL